MALRAYGVRVASATFFFSSTPTRIPETMAASVACRMAFMAPILDEDGSHECPPAPRARVSAFRAYLIGSRNLRLPAPLSRTSDSCCVYEKPIVKPSAAWN